MIGWYLLASVALGAYLGICGVAISFLSGNPHAGPQALAKNVPMLVLTVIGYVGFVLALNVVVRIHLVRDVWARVVASTTVLGIEAAANIKAKGELASALGEGFADGLDVAGF
jgi:hypothetical protein